MFYSRTVQISSVNTQAISSVNTHGISCVNTQAISCMRCMRLYACVIFDAIICNEKAQRIQSARTLSLSSFVIERTRITDQNLH